MLKKVALEPVGELLPVCEFFEIWDKGDVPVGNNC